jgi:transposase
MPYAAAVVERTMKVQEVMLQAFSGKLTWPQAEEILGWSPRTVRRWRLRYVRWGYDGLWDRRRQLPSPRRIPVAELERVLRLYRDHYAGFNGRHFCDLVRRDHAVTLSYSFIKRALQGAGLLPKRRARGRHRRRREPRPCFGELVHLDGSSHPWLALVPGVRQTLITVVDDATKRLLYAQLLEGGESTVGVMRALADVLQRYGLPQALYTDRARWAVHTPIAGAAADRTKLSQVGRALHTLGIAHILGYSPQARGRSERANRTLQGRLVNELRVAGIATVAGANRYLREHFQAAYDGWFAHPPADPVSAFVALGPVDLDQILCHEEARTVGRDNTVRLDGVLLQVAKQPGRRTCAGLHVVARRHLDGRHSLWLGPQRLGLYDSHGRPLAAPLADRSRVKQRLAVRSRC